MLHNLARALALPCLLTLASGCIDEARCDAALEGVVRAQREAAQRDQQIAWLGWRQAQLAAAVGASPARTDPEREALLARLASLEAENASLMLRLGRAERELSTPRAPAVRRRLDEAVPYDRNLLAAPRADAEDDGFVHRRAPRASRTLDEAVPYEAQVGHDGGRPPTQAGVRPAPREADRAPIKPAARTLDEAVPY